MITSVEDSLGWQNALMDEASVRFRLTTTRAGAVVQEGERCGGATTPNNRRTPGATPGDLTEAYRMVCLFLYVHHGYFYTEESEKKHEPA